MAFSRTTVARSIIKARLPSQSGIVEKLRRFISANTSEDGTVNWDYAQFAQFVDGDLEQNLDFARRNVELLKMEPRPQALVKTHAVWTNWDLRTLLKYAACHRRRNGVGKRIDWSEYRAFLPDRSFAKVILRYAKYAKQAEAVLKSLDEEARRIVILQ